MEDTCITAENEGWVPSSSSGGNAATTESHPFDPPHPSDPPQPPISASLIEARQPNTLCKSFELTDDGRISKSGRVTLVDGEVKTVTFESLPDFMAWRAALAPNQALVFGKPLTAPARVVTKQRLKAMQEAGGAVDGVIARDRDHFSWYPGPAIAMVDIDPHDSIPASVAEKLPNSPEGWRDMNRPGFMGDSGN